MKENGVKSIIEREGSKFLLEWKKINLCRFGSITKRNITGATSRNYLEVAVHHKPLFLTTTAVFTTCRATDASTMTTKGFATSVARCKHLIATIATIAAGLFCTYTSWSALALKTRLCITTVIWTNIVQLRSTANTNWETTCKHLRQSK